MIIIVFFGYLVAYALLLMAAITFFAGLCVSFGVYVISYYGLYLWSWVRHRSAPEWKYTRRRFTVNTDDLQSHAVVCGILCMVFLVIGFLAYALSDGDWSTTLGWTGALAAITGFFVWDDRTKTNRLGGTTYGEIKDRHDSAPR